MTALGIVSGHKVGGEIHYRGDDNVTREQVAKIMVELALRHGDVQLRYLAAGVFAGVKIGKWTLGSLLGGTGSSAAAGASAGGLLQIGGIAALAKSAWDNIVGIVNSTKEYSEAGYGNPLEQLLGGIETFYGKNGLGFEEHVRQA